MSNEIKRATLRDLRQMKDEGKLVQNTTPEKPEDLGPGFWDNARVVAPGGGKAK